MRRQGRRRSKNDRLGTTVFTYALDARVKPHSSATFFQSMLISEFFIMQKVNLSWSASDAVGRSMSQIAV